ncbi:MAG: acyltransferase [Promethearchaeota archaeon]
MKTKNSIQILRGIAIMEVILVHVCAIYPSGGIDTIPIISQIVRSAIPLFVFISGYLLSSRYWEDFSVKDFYKKRFKNIYFPYFFFCGLYIFLSPLLLGRPLEFTNNLLNILFNPWNFYYHFWFIALITSFYLFYPLLVKIFLKYEKQLIWVLIISIIIQIVWNESLFGILYLLGFLEGSLLYSILFYYANYFFFKHLSYFVLGVYINKNSPKIHSKSKKLYFLILPIVLFSALNSIFGIESFHIFINIPLIVLVFSLIKDKNNRFLEVLGKYSFGIYLVHVLILNFINKLWTLNIIPWYYYPSTFIATLLASYIVIFLISKLPKHKFLIGKLQRHQKIVIKFYSQYIWDVSSRHGYIINIGCHHGKSSESLGFTSIFICY